MKKSTALFLMLCLGALLFANGQKETANGMSDEEKKANLEKSLAIDVSDIRGSDGQLLLIYGNTRPVPAKPSDPALLDMWKIEYAGRQTQKLPMIESPKDGIIGKKIIMIQQSEHPYWTAFPTVPASPVKPTAPLSKFGIPTGI